MFPIRYQKWQAEALSRDFREAASLVEAEMTPPGPAEIVVKNLYAGVNASDLNITAGIYFGEDALPLDLGVEAAAEVAAVGDAVQNLSPGDHVLTSLIGGGYREYFKLPAEMAIPVPEATPEVLSVVVGALTASIGLEEVGRMGSDETVLITAAAGGVGQYAVQLAKRAGNHVIGTCSTDEKAAQLEKLGCDRPINYVKEDLAAVLADEYPDGIDLVFEGVGKRQFDAAAANLATRGRMVILGFVSEYQSGPEAVMTPRIYHTLLWKSASLHGFLFSDYPELIPEHMGKLLQDFFAGKLSGNVDATPFRGVAAVPEAIDHLHNGRNVGKVIVSF